MIGIYRIVNKINGKSYIGQSTAVSSVLKKRRGRKTIHCYHVVYVV